METIGVCLDESWDTMVGSLLHVTILSECLWDGRKFSSRIDFCCEASERQLRGDPANTSCFTSDRAKGYPYDIHRDRHQERMSLLLIHRLTTFLVAPPKDQSCQVCNKTVFSSIVAVPWS